jgi:TDG/mug DNA glycosylase family protein
MRRFAPKIIAFTSKNAAQNALGKAVEYGLQEVLLGRSQLFVLPSPSGLATRFFDPEIWRELARLTARL